MLRVARFLRAFRRPESAAVTAERAEIEVPGGRAPALLLRPPGRGPFPGWVVLHGITVPGIDHPELLRFSRALAGAGSVVLLPEVASWKALRVDPDAAEGVIAAAARHLARLPEVSGGGVRVVGFSFGATQALVTAARPDAGESIRAVLGFGGYCDLHRTVLFMLTGEHEWRGERHRLEPDPYGRWIVAANYLARVPEYARMEAVAEGARALAAEAGRRFVYAGDPVYDPLKERLRRGLSPEEAAVWDLIAPPTGVRPAAGPARELADRLLAAALAVHPELDPRPFLPGLRVRVRLAHGHGDRLVPFTETLRLRSLLPPDADVRVAVTRLFGHSGGAGPLPFYRYPAEAWRYLDFLSDALDA